MYSNDSRSRNGVRTSSARLFRAHSPVLLVELHNEMLRENGGAPDAALDELVRFGFAIFSPGGRLLAGDEIVSEPISRVIAVKNGAAVRT